MDQIPRAVLSEHFQEHMEGRSTLLGGVPDIPVRPRVLRARCITGISRYTPEPCCRDPTRSTGRRASALPGQVAVYYDANGLVLGGSGSAKLDFRRVPVQHRTGIFHPKNVFLLVEDEEADGDGYRVQDSGDPCEHAGKPDAVRLVGKRRVLSC